MRLGEFAAVQTGFPFRSRVKHDPQGSITIVQMRDIDDANLLHTREAIKTALPAGKGHHLLRGGDLLFRSRGWSNGAALVTADIGTAVLAAPMLLIRRRADAVLPAYLCWFINAPHTQALFAAMSEGTSVRMISAEALKDLEIPLPGMKSQRRIVAAATLAEREQTVMADIALRRHRLMTSALMQYAQKADK